jgi:hypothetical protein
MDEEVNESVLKDTLESIQESIEDKAENIAKLIKTFDANAKVLKEEEERLMNKRKSFESKVSYLKKYLQEQLEHVGIDKIKRPIFTISIQNNPQAVDIQNESLIPLQFMIPVDPKIDKRKVLEVLKSGEVVPGVELKQTRGLRIR